MPLPTLVSRNGKLVPPAQATVSVFSPALYGAYGVYESLQVVQGLVFAQAAHLDRLWQSAAMLELPPPAPRRVFEGWIDEVLAANRARDSVLRILMLGSLSQGSPRSEDPGESVAYLWPQAAPTYAAGLYSQGAAAITFEGERALPACKSLNTLVSSLARRRAAGHGAHEALLHHDGQLTEGSNSNLFAVLDGQVLTPPADAVLPGVTRDLVIKLAATHGVPLREAPLAVSDLPRWSECFITSTSRHVMPVTAIDGQPVGTGEPGPLTQRLADLFEAYFSAATVTSQP